MYCSAHALIGEENCSRHDPRFRYSVSRPLGSMSKVYCFKKAWFRRLQLKSCIVCRPRIHHIPKREIRGECDAVVPWKQQRADPPLYYLLTPQSMLIPRIAVSALEELPDDGEMIPLPLICSMGMNVAVPTLLSQPERTDIDISHHVLSAKSHRQKELNIDYCKYYHARGLTWLRHGVDADTWNNGQCPA